MRRITILAAAIAGCLTLTTPALADSIAYLKDGNVWKANPDGTRPTQLTSGGGAFSVSQADDGSMVVLTGKETLARLAPDGRVLGEIPTYVSDGQKTGTGVDTFGGPFDPQISPDGSKVAFEWYNTTYGASAGCTESSFPPCYTYRSSKGVGITYADRYTDPREFGLLTGWSYAQWLDSSTLMRSFAGTPVNPEAVFQTLQPGVDNNRSELMVQWFRDPEARDMVDMQLSPNRTSVVGVGGDTDELLRFYRVIEDPMSRDGASVERCWQLTDPAGGAFKDPTYSPDGTRVAYADAEGVKLVALGDTSVCPKDLSSALVIPGASSPDWGPADVPTVKAAQKQQKPKAKKKGKKKRRS